MLHDIVEWVESKRNKESKSQSCNELNNTAGLLDFRPEIMSNSNVGTSGNSLSLGRDESRLYDERQFWES